MKALVTGSAGFIGTHVSRALLADGFEVTGYDQKGSAEPGIDSVVGDLLDIDSLTKAVTGHDVIVHIGAIGDVYLAATNPELAASVNVTGSTNVSLAAEASGARVVYASTWEVYGDPVYEPVDEKHPCEPDHPYNITKLAGERMLLAANRLRGVPVIALRLGTAYGLGMRPNSVFEIFIDKARNGEPITIQGDGSQGRQFTHARDIARAFVLAAKSEARGIPLNVVSARDDLDQAAGRDRHRALPHRGHLRTAEAWRRDAVVRLRGTHRRDARLEARGRLRGGHGGAAHRRPQLRCPSPALGSLSSSRGWA